MPDNLQPLELFSRVFSFGDNLAIVDSDGSYGYRDLLNASAAVASTLLDGNSDLEQKRVAFSVQNGFQYVAVLWGIWRAGGIAVPLCTSHPPTELKFVVENSEAEIVVTDRESKSNIAVAAKESNPRLINSWRAIEGRLSNLPKINPNRGAMIIYTSGTTSKPKGVLTTHHNIKAQITSLVEAWGWRASDRIINVLPLHHVHGIINVVSCALWSGASCEMHTGFDASRVWKRFEEGSPTLFMAVPAIYGKLIDYWNTGNERQKTRLKKACKRIRLFVSGSAALPTTTFHQWKQISGHDILERYGMTEIGMALSNPLKAARRPGTVGSPLPGVDVRLVDEKNQPVETGREGEIQVSGNNVFKEYWRNPDATNEAFTDGWFRTGDIAVVEDDYYRILGRSNIDIIKTGGYKVSALEIEHVLSNHRSIIEVAVVGVPDEVWGERVGVAIVQEKGAHITPGWLRGWAKQYLAEYKVPTMIIKLNSLPRNVMGKVNKSEIAQLFENEDLIQL